MVDAEDARWVREVESLYPCGTVKHGGTVVGAWFTDHHVPSPSGTSVRWVTLLWRQECGVGACHAGLECEDIASWASDRCGGPASLQEPAADEFGNALLDMVADDGAHQVAKVVPPTRVPAVAVLHSVTRRAALDGFLSTLDPGALALAHRHGDQAALLGRAWPALDRTFSDDAPLAGLLRDRPAFAGTLLRLAGIHVDMARVLRDKPRKLDAALVTAAMADGVPKGFLPVLADAERFVTELEGRMGDELHGDGRLARMRRGGRLDWVMVLARRAARFPREWAPSGRAQWEAFVDLGPTLDAANEWCVERPELVSLINCGGDWVAFRERLHAATGLEAPVDIPASKGVEAAVSDIRDMADAYARDVLKPACAAAWEVPRRHSHAEQDWSSSAWALLNSGRSLPRMLEASRDWHRRRARMAMAKAAMPTALGESLSWGKGLPDATLDGVWFKVLGTDAELEDEGRDGPNADGSEGLMNCIAGYSDACLAGTARIVSLRVPGASPPVRLGVAEIHLVEGCDGLSFAVNDHRGPDNGEASRACQAALNGYVEALASGRLQVDVGDMEPVPFAGDEIAQGCRYDWTDAASRAAVRRTWDRLVPPALRTMSEEGLARLACANLRTFQAWSAKALVPGKPGPEAFTDDGWSVYDDVPVVTMAP